jgi:hypothetical protein
MMAVIWIGGILGLCLYAAIIVVPPIIIIWDYVSAPDPKPQTLTTSTPCSVFRLGEAEGYLLYRGVDIGALDSLGLLEHGYRGIHVRVRFPQP